MHLFIKVGSITNAQRGQRVLKNYGYSANIKRVANPSKEDGCGYAVDLYTNDSTPVSILSSNGINIRGVESL